MRISRSRLLRRRLEAVEESQECQAVAGGERQEPLRGAVGFAAMQGDRGPPRLIRQHLDVTERKAGNAGPQRLGNRFFGREARRERIQGRRGLTQLSPGLSSS